MGSSNHILWCLHDESGSRGFYTLVVLVGDLIQVQVGGVLVRLRITTWIPLKQSIVIGGCVDHC